MPCFWWQIYRRKYPTRTFKNLRFNTASRARRCVTKMQLQRPWKGLQKDFAPWSGTQRRGEPCHLQLVWAQKTKVTRTRKATGDYRQQQCANRARSQTMTTQHFLPELCLMLHYRYVALYSRVTNSVPADESGRHKCCRCSHLNILHVWLFESLHLYYWKTPVFLLSMYLMRKKSNKRGNIIKRRAAVTSEAEHNDRPTIADHHNRQ